LILRATLIARQPPRLGSFAAERPTRLVLEIEVAERLPGVVADDEAGVVMLLDRPGRWEAARGGHGAKIAKTRVSCLTITALPTIFALLRRATRS
jgi:hypothetical protein